jgi:hypothetical protein
MGAIGGLASAAGMSTQRLMNTVGAQGQYMFGAAGLTPFVGQMTAGQAAASYGTAFRSGLMSPAQLARMGGVEGASQSANAGLLAGLNTPYSMIRGMNALQGGSPGSIVGNMSKFGGSIAGNPLAGIGNMGLLGGAMMSNMAQNGGVGHIQEQLNQMAKVIPGAIGKNGKMEAGTAYALLTGVMGLQSDEAKAILGQLNASQDGRSRGMQIAGIDRAKSDFLLKFSDQNSMNKGIFTRPYNAVANLGRSIQKGGADIVSGINAAVGGTVDSFEQSMYEAMYGKNNASVDVDGEDFGSDRRRQISTAGAEKYLSGRGSLSTFGGNSIMMKAVADINKLASTDKNVSRMLGIKDKRKLLTEIHSMANNGTLPAIYKDKAQRGALADIILGSGTSDLSGNGKLSADRVHGGIAKAAGLTGKSTLQGAEVLSLVEDLRSGKRDPEKIARLEKLTGKSFMDPEDLDEFLSQAEKNTAVTGTYNVGAIFKSIGMNSTQLEDEIKSKGLRSVAKRLGVDGAQNTQELLAKLGDKMGLKIRDKGLDESKISAVADGDFTRYNDAMKGIDSQKTNLAKLAQNGMIDFNAYKQATTALDNEKSVLKFENAVDMFGVYVQAITTGKSVETVAKERSNMTKAGV